MHLVSNVKFDILFVYILLSIKLSKWEIPKSTRKPGSRKLCPAPNAGDEIDASIK